MPDNIVSRPYHPKMACEACCFGRGEHAEWCMVPLPSPEREKFLKAFFGFRKNRDGNFRIFDSKTGKTIYPKERIQ